MGKIKICPRCHGSGMEPKMKNKRCKECKGAGEIALRVKGKPRKRHPLNFWDRKDGVQ